MRRIGYFVGVVVIAFALISSYTVNTTLANEKSEGECIVCGKALDSHGKLVTIEYEWEAVAFYYEGCAKKYEKGHHDISHKEEEHPGKHKGDDKH